MATKENVDSLKTLFRQIEATKLALSEELKKVDADSSRSESYKTNLKERLRQDAAAQLNALSGEADKRVQELKNSAKPPAFDYNDEKLRNALDVIKLAGKKLPEEVADQILTDFRGKPTELKYIAAVFNNNELHRHAEAAEKEASATLMKASFPDRLSDQLYYSLTGNPETTVNFSEIENELNALAEK